MKKGIILSLMLSNFVVIACSSKKAENNFISTKCNIVCEKGGCNQLCTTIQGNIKLKKVKK